MKITFLKRKNKRFTAFVKSEWELINPEHYGKKLDWDYWESKKVRIKAEENGKIVGGLSGHIMAGVFHIEELIIDHTKRGLGIGKKILEEGEQHARKNEVHMLYLETGENWKAVKFYENLGFEKVVLLKNFYSKINFWIMTKYL